MIYGDGRTTVPMFSLLGNRGDLEAAKRGIAHVLGNIHSEIKSEILNSTGRDGKAYERLGIVFGPSLKRDVCGTGALGFPKSVYEWYLKEGSALWKKSLYNALDGCDTYEKLVAAFTKKGLWLPVLESYLRHRLREVAARCESPVGADIWR